MPDAHRDDIAKLESLYAEHPEGRIFTHLAEAYRKAGELDRADEVLRQGLERHPDYSSAHVVMGRVLADQGRAEEASAAFHRVLDLDSHNLVALRALGDLARAGGREGDALGYYARLLDVEPADDQVRELMDSLTAEEAAQEEAQPLPTSDSMADTDAPAADVEDEEPFEPWAVSEEELDVESDPWSAPAEPEPEAQAEAAPEAEAELDPWVAPAEAETEADPWDSPDEEESEFEPWTVIDEEPEPEEPWSAEDLEVGPAAETEEPEEPDEEAEDWSPGLAYGLPEPDDEPGPPSMSPGVMTETIAQVYARQGLYDRAAEVYRELVRERPDDSDLRDRLEEMEALASSGSPVQGLEPADFDPSESDVPPMPGLEAAEIDPDTGLSSEALPEQSSPEPWDADASYDEWLPQGEGGLDDTFGDDTATQDRADVGSDEEGSVWVGGDWSDAPDETPYAWAEADPESDVQEDTSAPIGSYFRSLLDWTPGAAEVDGEDETEAEPDEVAPETSSEAAEATDDEDDDLDTFRSWLENLKQ